MNAYKTHVLLNVETVKCYVRDKLQYFNQDEDIEAIEIGDGNINYVFKVWNPKTNKSIIIKQADKFLRSSGRPLDVYRNKIEAEVLKKEGALAPGYVPHVYAYDVSMCILAMEDISEYENMRHALMEGKTFEHFASDIAAFLAFTLLPTTDLVMNQGEKKDNVKVFSNKELCDITEDLVLCEPYYNYKGRNIVIDENKAFVQEFLYDNDLLKANVGELRETFMNHAQALVHGDLHTGSIFIHEKGIKVIDPEFAFYGPIGYDIGNVIGNLFFAWAYQIFSGHQDRMFLSWIEKTIADTLDVTMQEITRVYDETITFALYKTEEFKKRYLHQIQSDALGYAGTEIIRRVVGDSKVEEVTAIHDIKSRIRFERALIKQGIHLIMQRHSIATGTQLTKAFRIICA